MADLTLGHFITCDVSDPAAVTKADETYQRLIYPRLHRRANCDAPEGMRYVPLGDLHISTRRLSDDVPDEEGMSEGRRYVQEFQLVPE